MSDEYDESGETDARIAGTLHGLSGMPEEVPTDSSAQLHPGEYHRAYAEGKAERQTLLQQGKDEKYICDLAQVRADGYINAWIDGFTGTAELADWHTAQRHASTKH